MSLKSKIIKLLPGLYRLYQAGKYPYFNKIAERALSRTGTNTANELSGKFSGKIFCIGSGKTGTTSLEMALASFGYDMAPQGRAEMLAKECQQGDMERLIKFCALHEAFQDSPFCWADYYQTLDKAFPESKFILTIRDSAEQWFESLCRFHTMAYSSGDHLPTAEDLKNSRYGYKGMAYDNYEAYFDYPNTPLYDQKRYMAFYNDRNAAIQRYFMDQPDRLLVLNVKDDSAYQRLANFLNITVSANQRMPWLNKTP